MTKYGYQGVPATWSTGLNLPTVQYGRTKFSTVKSLAGAGEGECHSTHGITATIACHLN